MAKVRRPINSSPVAGSLNKIVVVAVIAAVAGAAFYWGGGDSDSTGSATGSSAYALPTPAHGPADAPVILAKWTDFQ
ncbi:MAG TPA: hypothetical protein EYN06_04585 [Myxococcales bacterium]|nr:hypothetical protein [Myxococcales bacterium]HIN85738.1 hypothetical protein [Myxococcales bacterium]